MMNIPNEHVRLMYTKIISLFIIVITIVLFYINQNKKRVVEQLIQLYSKKHLYNESIGAAESNKNVFLNRKKQTLRLLEVIPLTETSKIFIFTYPKEYDELGLGLCKHIKFFSSNSQGNVSGESNQKEGSKEKGMNEICRSYTPIYVDTEKREIHFVIRIYRPTERFPEGGKMSLYLDQLKVNDTLYVSGSYGILEYKGNNTFAYTSKIIERKKHIVMIAGGTGMTPFFRLINYILLSENTLKKDTAFLYMTFIYANRNEEEIMLKSIFDEYQEKHENFKIVYSIDRCLNTAKEKFYDHIGFINETLLKKYVLEYSKLHIPIEPSDTLILLCGPPSMNAFVSKSLRNITQAEIIQL